MLGGETASGGQSLDPHLRTREQRSHSSSGDDTVESFTWRGMVDGRPAHQGNNKLMILMEMRSWASAIGVCAVTRGVGGSLRIAARGGHACCSVLIAAGGFLGSVHDPGAC